VDHRDPAPRAPWTGPARRRVGVAPRRVLRLLARHGLPKLPLPDPITGDLIQGRKIIAVRHGRERPGEVVYMDVKKLGRIPDGCGWRGLAACLPACASG
jgi:hypothetical protein